MIWCGRKKPRNGEGKGTVKRKTVYLIRHGQPETGFGQESVCLGRKDVPLSQEGRSQASRLGSFFLREWAEQPALIFTSPLQRCVRTAQIMAEAAGWKKTEIMTVDGFTEVDTGIWDGLPFTRIRKQYPQAWAERGAHMGSFRIPGGETLQEAGTRFLAALRRVLSENGDERILVVSHAGVIRACLCLLEGKDMDGALDYKIPYGGVMVVEVDSLEERRDLK